MRIVLVGLGKSGTTALFYTVAAVLPAHTLRLFEPATLPTDLSHRDVLVKTLATPALDWRPFLEFGKRVFVVRDPRDRLVSHLLYSIYNHARPVSEAEAERLVGLVERKERTPGEVALWQLSAELERIMGRDPRLLMQERHDAALRLLRDDPGLHRVRYERFVSGDLDELSRYLELPLSGPREVPESLRRVARTQSFGAWKHWFTPADVESLRPLLSPLMKAFEYEDAWELAASPILPPTHGSVYLRRLIEEQRRRTQPDSLWARLGRAVSGAARPARETRRGDRPLG